ncbi:MAG: SDR family NAD(P)-dependent oxidoreductase, partial [Anaerotignum sp.]
MLKGKTAVVTGGSRGIGKAICLKFAENGADIAFLYAGNTVKAEETQKELEALGVKAKAYQCSVADADAVAAVVKEIVKEFGGIQILVNNAGITKDKLVPMMKAADFDAVIDTNLKGVFYMIKGVYPLF